MLMMETTTENKLPFLDVLVYKLPSGTFETSVYRKATNAHIVLHYDSNSPASHKRSCMTALFSRITTHCSNAEARNQERSYLHRQCLPALLHQTCITSPDPSISFYYQRRDCPPPTWRALPYVKNVSELIARHLRPFNFFIAHKPTTSLRGTIKNVKGTLPTAEQLNVVYYIPCSDCSNAYVGETGRQLSTRVK